MESARKEKAQVTCSNMETYTFGRAAGCRGFLSGGEENFREQEQLKSVRFGLMLRWEI